MKVIIGLLMTMLFVILIELGIAGIMGAFKLIMLLC